MPPETETEETTTPAAEIAPEVTPAPVDAPVVDVNATLDADGFAAARDAKIRAALDEQAPAEEVVPPVEGEEPTAEETEAATAAADAAEDELPDDATDEERAAARAAAEEGFYAGRYKTREDAEAGIAEKDATIQRLHNERDQLKAELEKRGEPEPAAEATAIDRPAWKEWASTRIEAVEDPVQAEALALQALTEGGYDGYEVLLEAWLEAEDPSVRARATIFNNQMMMEIADQRARVAAQPALDSSEKRTTTDEAAAARAQIMAKRTDFADYEDEMSEVVKTLDEPTRAMLTEMAGRGVEGKAQALDYVYLEARVSKDTRKTTARATERAQRRASADADKLGATTSTSEATPSRTPLTAAEIEKNKMVNARRKEWGLELLPEE